MSKPLKHSEPLHPSSFRLSQEHLFKLAVIAGIRDESGATLIETVIDRLGKEIDLGPWTWGTLWDPEESVRWLRVYGMPLYKPRPPGGGKGDEGKLVQFLYAHSDFFWSDKARKHPRRAHAVILWSKRWELAKQWHKTRETDHFSVAKAMLAILKKADPDGKLEVPELG